MREKEEPAANGFYTVKGILSSRGKKGVKIKQLEKLKYTTKKFFQFDWRVLFEEWEIRV